MLIPSAVTTFPVSGGGGSLLIEGFESLKALNLPDGYPGWEFMSAGTGAYSLSALHVTQGTTSYKVVETTNNFSIDTQGSGSGFMDLTGYSSVSIDVFVTTLSGIDTVNLQLFDDLGSPSSDNTSSAGATTLTASLSGLNVSAIYVILSIGNTLMTGIEVYFDNLRAT